jgi:uncharacterized membrane protein (UPF0127 family)
VKISSWILASAQAFSTRKADLAKLQACDTVAFMKRALLTLLFSGLAFSALAQDTPQTNLPRIKLQAGMYQIDTQVAQTPDQRSIGLMFRKDMPQHEGMLFVFEQPATQCFWMKNTLLPLTAAFVADDGTIVNLADMKPQTTDSHCSEKPVRFVLEMHQGWFAKKGLKAGSRLSGVAFKP